jgi:hypothetical protein
MLPPIGEEEEDDLQVGPEMPKAKKRKVMSLVTICISSQSLPTNYHLKL